MGELEPIHDDPLYEARLSGWLEGYHYHDAEIAKLNWTADRLYAEMCRRTPPRTPDLIPYSQMEHRRAEIYNRVTS